MVDRLLRVHMQTLEGLWAWETLGYNMGSVIVSGSLCVHESPGTYRWPKLCLIGVSQRQQQRWLWLTVGVRGCYDK